MTATAHPLSATVIDNPASAWDESDQQAVTDLKHTFGDDLVEQYRNVLDHAGRELIETHLRTEWRNHGYRVAFATTNPDGDIYATPTDDTYQQVWQAAADKVTARALVLAADLGHVFPLATDMERLRAALIYRLYDGPIEVSETAQEQRDGWREAIEAAVSPAQLHEISALIA